MKEQFGGNPREWNFLVGKKTKEKYWAKGSCVLFLSSLTVDFVWSIAGLGRLLGMA